MNSCSLVKQHTDPITLERIRRRTQMSIAYHRRRPDMIDARLTELDAEWDVERALRMGSTSLTLGGIALSLLRGRRWILLSAAVQGFYLQHTLAGWCPPLPVFRKLGFRTTQEIDEERHSLLAIRGDYDDLTAHPQPPSGLDTTTSGNGTTADGRPVATPKEAAVQVPSSLTPSLVD